MDERFLHRELVGAAQDRMLEYVEHASVVGRVGPETDGESFFLVLSIEVEELRASGGVVHGVCGAVDFRDGFDGVDGETVDALALLEGAHGWLAFALGKVMQL